MGDERKINRTYVEIDDREYVLGQDQDLVDVMSKIEAAAQTKSAFVELSSGERLVSVLISSQSRVVVTVRPEQLAEVTHVRPELVDVPRGLVEDWDL